ncbi:nucleotidyltransferase family protein [Asticcacaulis endophyticus]|uniref:Nucleotidyltransferase n=1 Tax=Asticcacaulis endophyticus TaxID=1395890 RepID=A0A918Q0N6_9CAUL|nr:nucleotidyltransferase domain-containing protein [Asticcacaulis endophyticus]GGZ29676.1 nucleotidyltransferase [Asticcacaulis endophyticus]
MKPSISVLQDLKALAPDLMRLGVLHLYLFGSQSRGDGRTDSDIDLFFDYNDPKFSLIELLNIKAYIEARMGKTADIMTRASLHPRLKASIEQSAIKVF